MLGCAIDTCVIRARACAWVTSELKMVARELACASNLLIRVAEPRGDVLRAPKSFYFAILQEFGQNARKSDPFFALPAAR